MCLLLFSSLIAIGQVIFSLGLSLKSWPLMFVGRLVFGFGGESFTVANSALLAQWFKGKELAFSFGVNLSISKLGSVINNLVSPILTEKVNIIFALWFGAILCAACVGCVLLTIPIDIAIEETIQSNLAIDNGDDSKSVLVAKIDAIRDDDNSTATTAANPIHDDKYVVQTDASRLSDNVSGRSEVDSNVQSVSLKDAFKFKHIFWILVVSCMVVYGCVLPFNNISSSLLLERDYFKDVSGCKLIVPNQCFNFPGNGYRDCPSQWFQPPLPTNATVEDVVYSPFSSENIDCNKNSWKDSCASSDFCSKQSKAESEASVIMSIPYIISACLSPPLGYLIDLYGFRAVIAAIAPAILILVHMLLGFSHANPIGPLVGQGLAYTGFVSVLWPSVPLVVLERETGLAFGVVTSAQNLATAVIPEVAAAIYSGSGDKYIPYVELLFVTLASMGFLVGLYMNYYDWFHDHHLNGYLWRNMWIRLSGKRPYSAFPTIEDEESNGGATVLLDPLKEDHEHAKEDIAAEREGVAGEAWLMRPSPAQSIRHHSRTSSRGGSFTSYEEALRGGAFRRPGSISQHL
jgi:MFS family permease